MQILLCSLHFRGKGRIGNGSDVSVYEIGNHICIGDYHLVCLFLAKIAELLQHLLGSSVIQMDISVCILEFHTAAKYLSVYFILVVKEMSITSSHDGFTIFFAKLYYSSVKVTKPFFVCNSPLGNHEHVITYRLNFEIIIEAYDFSNLAFGLVIKYRLHKLACLACGTYNKSFSVLFKLRTRNSRVTLIVFQISQRNQLVQIFQTLRISDKNYLVICR